LNTDMRKFESSQKDESRAQLADSSKTYKKHRDFHCFFTCIKNASDVFVHEHRSIIF